MSAGCFVCCFITRDPRPATTVPTSIRGPSRSERRATSDHTTDNDRAAIFVQMVMS